MSIRVALLAVFILFSATGAAGGEFSLVGPRAIGLGGAGVAATTDPLAVHWNPAGLAMEHSGGWRIQVSAHGIDGDSTLATLQ